MLTVSDINAAVVHHRCRGRKAHGDGPAAVTELAVVGVEPDLEAVADRLSVFGRGVEGIVRVRDRTAEFAGIGFGKGDVRYVAEIHIVDKDAGILVKAYQFSLKDRKNKIAFHHHGAAPDKSGAVRLRVLPDRIAVYVIAVVAFVARPSGKPFSDIYFLVR